MEYVQGNGKFVVECRRTLFPGVFIIVPASDISYSYTPERNSLSCTRLRHEIISNTNKRPHIGDLIFPLFNIDFKVSRMNIVPVASAIDVSHVR